MKSHEDYFSLQEKTRVRDGWPQKIFQNLWNGKKNQKRVIQVISIFFPLKHRKEKRIWQKIWQRDEDKRLQFYLFFTNDANVIKKYHETIFRLDILFKLEIPPICWIKNIK